MPEIGEPFPDFELPNQEGRNVRLSDFRGRKVILFAFPRAGTVGCNRQACGYRDVHDDIESANAVVLGISADGLTRLTTWKSRKNLPFELLSDSDHSVLEMLGAWGPKVLGIRMPAPIRSMWVIDEDGVLVDAKVGVSPSESVARSLGDVRGPAGE